MGELHLRITEKNGKTVTRIGKAKNKEKIVFFNDGDKDLTVTFDRDVLEVVAGKRLQRIRRRGRTAFRFTVAPNNEKSFTVKSSAVPDTELKYTAKIGSATLEDPIIIIE